MNSDELHQKLDKSLDDIIEDQEHNNREKKSDSPRKAIAPPKPGSVTNRVYVGNLPWRTSWQDLKDHFRQVGEPIHASVFMDESGRSKGCGIVEFATKEEAMKAISTLNDTTIGETGRLIFVREDREDRNAAPTREAPRHVEQREREGGGRGRGRGGLSENRGGWAGGRGAATHEERPRPVHAEGESTKGRQVFVGNLPYNTSWQDLKDYFRPAGNIIRADVLFLPSGRSKGQGTVCFERKEEAQKAIQLFNTTEFQGRKITVHEDKFAA